MDSSVRARERRKLFQCLKPPIPDYDPICDPPLSSDQYERIKNNNKKKARLSLSGGLKAVLVKSFLGKKFRKKKSRKDSFQSGIDDPFNEIWDNEEAFTNSNSSISASTRTSISSSSGSEGITSPHCLDSKEFKMEKAGTKICRCVCNHVRVGMFMSVVCLFALVFGGKPCAIIMCTSMWLFFAPGRRRSKQVHNESLVYEVIEPDEYKKKVILDGLS